MTARKKLGDELYTLYRLTKRPLLIFLKDTAAVFFSILAPLIILLLYVLFLGDVQINSVKASLPPDFSVDESLVRAFVDSWMLSGVMSVSCITVSLSANTVMVQDKERGFNKEILASPVSKGLVTIGYFLYNLVVTVFICTIVYAVCLIYLAASGGFYLTAAKCLETYGIILLSCLSSTLITVFVAGFFKTNSAFSAFVGIVSAVIGFIIGAYMPTSMFPDAIQSVICFFPGSYSAALFRNSLMSGAFDKLGEILPAEFTKGLADSFSMKLDFFGHEIGVGVMYAVLAASAVLFLLINLIVSRFKKF